jgi:hypothetical protein
MPVLRLIEAFPAVTAVLMVGSVLLAVSGLYLERRAHRALQGQQDRDGTAWSPWRGGVMADVAQVLQLLPLVVITVISWVALFTFRAP